MIDFAHVLRYFLLVTALGCRCPDAEDLAHDILTRFLAKNIVLPARRAQPYLRAVVRNAVASQFRARVATPFSDVGRYEWAPGYTPDFVSAIDARTRLRKLQASDPVGFAELAAYTLNHRHGQKRHRPSTNTRRVRIHRLRRRLRA